MCGKEIGPKWFCAVDDGVILRIGSSVARSKSALIPTETNSVCIGEDFRVHNSLSFLLCVHPRDRIRLLSAFTVIHELNIYKGMVLHLIFLVSV